MAAIVALFGMTHHPFFFRLAGLPANEQPPFVPAWLEKGDGLRRLLQAGEGRQLTEAERTSALHFTDEERRALVERDIAALYALGAHPFLLLTIMIPVYEDRFSDFITFAHAFRDKIAHLGRPGFRT